RLDDIKSQIVSQTAFLQEKINSLQHRINDNTTELAQSQAAFDSLPAKEAQLQELNAQRIDVDSLDQKKEQLNELLTKTIQMITKNETLLAHAQHLKESIATLESCPLCLQTVHSSHKQFIQEQEDQKITLAHGLLSEFQGKKIEIQEQREKVQESIKKAIEQSNRRARLELELQQLQSRREQRQQQQQQLQQWQRELAVSKEQLAKIQLESNLESVQQHLQQIEAIKVKLLQRRYLEQQLRDLQQQQNERKKQSEEVQRQLTHLAEQIAQYPDCSVEINVQKKAWQEAQQLEKYFSVQQAQLQTQLHGLSRSEENIVKQLATLRELHQKAQQRQQLYHWLEEYFLRLTYTIEKQVMLSIYHLFNQLFQEWFSILIDDASIYSRIDDSFYPVIEQNGYEVPFLHLSGGEKTSAALAYRLALNRVINDVIHTISTKDLLILDEPTDGFSSEQLDKVREVLERLQLRQTIIVSHESKIESFVENVIHIQKEGHTSMVMSSG
ncbi:AAA family ATPase, partial [Candidatus Woesearchaeota archaeon]|nr:AAA family ATPase [Candidatus Woesearchaeota archaeon]